VSQNVGTVASQSMLTAYSQAQVNVAQVNTSKSGASWAASFAAGYSLTPYTHFTFGALPTKGNSYSVQCFDTSGAAMGNSVAAAAYTPNDLGVQTTNFTAYIIPLGTLGVSGRTIGGVRITDTSGNATNLLYLSAIGFYS
jgi:hypothetical protein